MKRLLKFGIGFFAILAITSIVFYHFKIRDMVFGPIAILMGIFACFCLGKLRSIEYKNEPLKMRRLRYGYLLLVLVILLDIFFFWFALQK